MSGAAKDTSPEKENAMYAKLTVTNITNGQTLTRCFKHDLGYREGDIVDAFLETHPEYPRATYTCRIERHYIALNIFTLRREYAQYLEASYSHVGRGIACGQIVALLDVETSLSLKEIYHLVQLQREAAEMLLVQDDDYLAYIHPRVDAYDFFLSQCEALGLFGQKGVSS